MQQHTLLIAITLVLTSAPREST
jgi:hypothetical protein